MAVAYKKNSLYSKTKSNSKFLETYVPPITISYENTKEITLTAKHNLRPDVLAFELYGDADYCGCLCYSIAIRLLIQSLTLKLE